ncbi:MAG TPA: FAD binding domain-containing protein [Xanthobacteraceae bacterium]|jgi:carbon-monoxide dehydrogenase medium subunit/xanthine dehydrogenase FAD-binding subunit
MLMCDAYLMPRSLAEAFGAMAEHAGRFRLVAGATDILPWAREGRAGDVTIPVLIDVSRIPELRERGVTDNMVRLGAATPIQRFLDDRALAAALPSMPRCAVWFADDQIRETATIGGNLVNASPAADGVPPLMIHDARVELASPKGRRTVALTDFITGPSRVDLGADEILTAIECAPLNGYGGSFEKVGHRRSLVISVACVAAAVKLDASGERFDDVRLAVGGIGPVPRRLHDIEKFLCGAPIDNEHIDRAGAMPLDLVQSRSRQAYRREVLRGFVVRALLQAAQAAGAEPRRLAPAMEAAYA